MSEKIGIIASGVTLKASTPNCKTTGIESVKVSETSLKFSLRGIHYIKPFYDISFYLLTTTFTLKWDSGRKEFHIVEYLPQKISVIILLTLQLVYMVVVCASAILKLSSNKNDLQHLFKTARDVISVFTNIMMLYTALSEKHHFNSLIATMKRKVSRYHFKISQTFWPYVFIVGIQVGNMVRNVLCTNGSEEMLSMAFAYLPCVLEENTIFYSALSWVASLICIHMTVVFLNYQFFNLSFVLLYRANVKSFVETLRNVSDQSRNLMLLEEYLELKSLLNSINQCIQANFLSLFLSIVPLLSYFMSYFSEIPAYRLAIYISWVIVIIGILFIAADANALAADIKKILVERKRIFEKVCADPSDVYTMLMDMTNGSEIGISCFGCFTISYSSMGTVILNTITFAIILIQAKD
ncbi:unnamed protein product [Orchesella dallaii]|uniref:Gustatory receptor n=1 Tax=Orchesella dallaii TaxID=48710 RepID=A0ABP1S337_9HEXA